jgi:hypothetical protein
MHPFYPYIETAYSHSIISGYADRTFRPSNNATRAQIAKIVSLALADCPTLPPAPTCTPAAGNEPEALIFHG